MTASEAAGKLHAAFLTHTPPLPLMSGERIRTWNLLRELARRGWAVSLFSLSSTKPAAAERQLLEATCAEVVLAPFSVSTLVRSARVVRDVVLRQAFQSDFFFSHAAARTCRRWLPTREFDVVVLGQLYMASYVPEEIFP